MHQFDVLVRSGSTHAYPHGEALVAALAAAIEETDAEQDDRWGFYSDMPEAEQRLHEAKVARRTALSALRARAGESGDGES